MELKILDTGPHLVLRVYTRCLICKDVAARQAVLQLGFQTSAGTHDALSVGKRRVICSAWFSICWQWQCNVLRVVFWEVGGKRGEGGHACQ